MVDQYEDVGRLFAKALQKEFANPPDPLTVKHQIAARILERVQTESIFTEFYACFKAWVRGGGISELYGMYLMVDNLEGCQTMMVRYQSGVGMIHTEEDFNDIKSRMSGNHTIEFKDNGRRLLTLVYNNLIPGSALFGWQKDMLIAVDALFIREEGIENIEKPMLANIIGWIVWHATVDETDHRVLIPKLKRMGEMIDGYAINVVRRIGKKVQGYKVSFARNDWEVEKLGNKIGSNLRQVNLLEPHYVGENRSIMEWQAPREAIGFYGELMFRLQNMRELAEKYQKWLSVKLEADKVEKIHLYIMYLMFQKYRSDFVNEDMGAACVGIVDSEIGTSVSTKLNDEREITKLEYIDQQ